MEKSCNKGYWKFNSTLLNKERFNNEILEHLNLTCSDKNLNSYREKWEFFKFKVRQISIKHSKLKAMQNKEKELEIIQELSHICSKPFFNEDDKQRKNILQSELDDYTYIYLY